jgi:hypothetical protein
VNPAGWTTRCCPAGQLSCSLFEQRLPLPVQLLVWRSAVSGNAAIAGATAARAAAAAARAAGCCGRCCCCFCWRWLGLFKSVTAGHGQAPCGSTLHAMHSYSSCARHSSSMPSIRCRSCCRPGVTAACRQLKACLTRICKPRCLCQQREFLMLPAKWSWQRHEQCNISDIKHADFTAVRITGHRLREQVMKIADTYYRHVLHADCSLAWTRLLPRCWCTFAD